MSDDKRHYVIVPLADLTPEMLADTEHKSMDTLVRDNSGENVIVKFRPEKTRPGQRFSKYKKYSHKQMLADMKDEKVGNLWRKPRNQPVTVAFIQKAQKNVRWLLWAGVAAAAIGTAIYFLQ